MYLLLNSSSQICIQHNVASTLKENQDCVHEIVSSSWYAFAICFINNSYTIVYLIIHLLHKLFSELTIPCNEECNLPRMPFTKNTGTEYNLSLLETPSKRYVLLLLKSNEICLRKKCMCYTYL